MDLSNDQQLAEVLAKIDPMEVNAGWVNNIVNFLDYVRAADLDTRKTHEFQRRLWEDNPVSGIGMGTVDISAALDDPEFCSWMAEESFKLLPESPDARKAFLQNFFNQIVEKLKQYSRRVPWMKIFRALAALYPRYFTTITYRRMAFECHRAWFGKRRKKPGPLACQLDMMAKLDQILGPAEDSTEALAIRMTLPWMVYEAHVQVESAEPEVESANSQGDIELRPLPALQRRKGLNSVRNGLAMLASAVSFVVDGVTREELIDFLRGEFPDYSDASLRTVVSLLKNEFYVVQEEGGVFTPTSRGESYLLDNDPSELVPLLITRTLGVDHLFIRMKNGPVQVSELLDLLQSVNPGWKSQFAPRALLKWMRDFELVEDCRDGNYALTESGRFWANQIDWEPEFLPKESVSEDVLPVDDAAKLDMRGVNQERMIASTIDGLAFSPRLVSQLHVGLWANPRRHFAILAGLSGSGKTLLAQRYGQAVMAQFALPAEDHVLVMAVQPGWYDPSPLFGYINPLQRDHYVRSPLLDFLLKAVNRPDQPFMVILDEMNLSHPEQYFSPVLSAMESGEDLCLHNEGDSFDGVPGQIPFPANVAIIGTVNMDETTHGISDKVLDRAFTLEFWDISLDDYPRWGSFGLDAEELTTVQACLAGLLDALAPERLHFGWRTVEDVLSYLSLARQASGFSFVDSLDDVVYARVLPKLRGTESERLRMAMDETIKILDQHGLERSVNKVKSLKSDLADIGMMRFWR
ncbi:restriction endonuclease-like GTPase [Alcanivorax jadensis T9]|uniref:Restriction endonuclease-like GTPase n=1 Tax=Alcanivorax jadensis T9 TaxID=1177181 RepID=A0ABR4WEH3_9GAMM|nr:hypothetical protein [Alcanivorax jadensis]KGD61444.1 restriction endonuclease-like GTPase [Alcanivorax jadensis T9]MBP23443.1 restriction endonuclease [Alcanivorax sp.]